MNRCLLMMLGAAALTLLGGPVRAQDNGQGVAPAADTLAEVAIGTLIVGGASALDVRDESLLISADEVVHRLTLANPTDSPLTATLSVLVEDHRLAADLGYRIASDPGGPNTPLTLTVGTASLPLDRVSAAMLVQGQDVTWALEAAGLPLDRLYAALAESRTTPPPDALTAEVHEALAVLPAAPGLMDLQPAIRRSASFTLPAGADARLSLSYQPLPGALPLWQGIVSGDLLPALAEAFCLDQTPDLAAWRRRQRAWQRSMDSLGSSPFGPSEARILTVLGGPHDARTQGPLTVRIMPPPQGLVIGCTPMDWQPEASGVRVLTAPPEARPLPLRLALLSPGGAAGLLPQSAERPLNDADVAELLARYDATVLRYARNEIFARHGYIFNDPDLQRYFSRQPWYEPVSPDVTLEAMERANVLFLVAAEQNVQ